MRNLQPFCKIAVNPVSIFSFCTQVLVHIGKLQNVRSGVSVLHSGKAPDEKDQAVIRLHLLSGRRPQKFYDRYDNQPRTSCGNGKQNSLNNGGSHRHKHPNGAGGQRS